MAKKYNYARTIAHADGGTETFGVEGGDSFEEVKKMVNRGIYERKLEKDYVDPNVPEVSVASLPHSSEPVDNKPPQNDNVQSPSEGTESVGQ